jgi:hypothetical protein
MGDGAIEIKNIIHIIDHRERDIALLQIRPETVAHLSSVP